MGLHHDLLVLNFLKAHGRILDEEEDDDDAGVPPVAGLGNTARMSEMTTSLGCWMFDFGLFGV